jgi:hypothetical protein
MSHREETPHEKALRELLEEARRSGESRSAARRHHLVPVFYLTRWADSGKIRVTNIDEGKSWVTSPKKAASETDYYRIESPDLDPEEIPPLLFEVTLSKIEQWGADFIEAAVEDPVGTARDDEIRVLFSLYMAFQFVRGRSYRAFASASVTDFFKLTYGEITDEGIRHALREKGLDPAAEQIALFRSFVDQLNSGDLTIGPQQASVIGMSGKLAEQIGQHLFSRGWYIYQVPEILLTCDEPVVPIAGPPYSRTERGGVGNAGVVIFPLTPGLLLVMFDGVNALPARPYELNYGDIADLNREIAAASCIYTFERPGRNVASAFKLPKAPAPIYQAPPMPVDDTGEKYLIRSHRPNRWANVTHPPPWPVERWFRMADM